VRLGGTFIPAGQQIFRVDTPFGLREFPKVAAKYEAVTFSRDVAVRRRKVEFLGLGHPLVDALIAYLKSPKCRGSVSNITRTTSNDRLSVRWYVSVQTENGKTKHYYRHVALDSHGSIQSADERSDLELLKIAIQSATGSGSLPVEGMRQSAEGHLSFLLAELRGSVDGVAAIRPDLVGLAVSS
jgi:hypothetical protein